MNLRICKKCGEEKELNSDYFNFYSKKDQKYKHTCKVCENSHCREYHKNNRDIVLERKSDYYRNNREKERDRGKRYAKTEIGRLNHNNRAKKFHNKHKVNVSYKLRKTCSKAVWKMLKKNNSSKKSYSIMQFLPYSIEELKMHLENQFDNKMSWANYGIYWEIDHIMPQSDLPYDSMAHPNFKKCWALSNLRPYPADLNSLDGATRVRHNGNNNVLP